MRSFLNEFVQNDQFPMLKTVQYLHLRKMCVSDIPAVVTFSKALTSLESIGVSLTWETESLLRDLLPRLSGHIKEIEVTFTPHDQTNDRMLGLMRKCDNLSSLSLIQEEGSYVPFKDMNIFINIRPWGPWDKLKSVKLINILGKGDASNYPEA